MVRYLNDDHDDGAEAGAHHEARGKLELQLVGEGCCKVEGRHALPLHDLVHAAHAGAPASIMD